MASEAMQQRYRRMLLFLVVSAGALGWQGAGAASKSNPADELADLINGNRTVSSKQLGAMEDNAGLACIALQYAHSYQQRCEELSQEKPDPALLNGTFAAACGVQPATVATPLSGSLALCQSQYVSPAAAFGLLMGGARASAVVLDPNHTQMGVAVASYEGGSPFYWVALFSDSPSPNSTFVFSSGVPLVQHDGCFSGTGQPCSAAFSLAPSLSFFFLVAIAASACFL